MNLYLLQENGSHILLENGAGAIILEEVGVPGPAVDWQAGGRGRPYKKRRNETDELFKRIEHTLEVALGLAPEPVEVTAGAESPPPQAWSDERLQEAVQRLERLFQDSRESRARMERLRAMLRAYEEAKAKDERERIDEEEAWILMS